MKFLSYHIIICALVFFSCFKAECQPKDVSGTLLDLYDRILFTSSDVEKERLNDSIIVIIDGYSLSDSVLTHRFSNLRFLGQILSSDKRVKIINWNVMLRDGTNRYFFFLIRKTNQGSGNQVIHLAGANSMEEISSGRTYSEDDWYGSLYYAIEPCRKDYVVLGLDFGGSRDSRKIIDVISFTPEGGLIFGKQIFSRGNEKKFREVIEYSSESVVTLRFLSQKKIVFDNLVSFSTGDENEKSLGTGLSVDGYIYKKGIWKFTTGIDARNPRK
jgi:hypothetical protein